MILNIVHPGLICWCLYNIVFETEVGSSTPTHVGVFKPSVKSVIRLGAFVVYVCDLTVSSCLYRASTVLRHYFIILN